MGPARRTTREGAGRRRAAICRGIPFRVVERGAGSRSASSSTTRPARRLGEALDTLVGLIDDGAFPARPGVVDRTSYKNCQWCDFDSLCTADRDRAWQRVRSDASVCGATSRSSSRPNPSPDDLLAAERGV